MAGIYRRLRPPRRPPLDTEQGLHLPGLLPLSARGVAALRLMSAVVDALGMRDGAVLADTPGLDFAPTQAVSVIKPVSRERAVDAFLERATALGYRPSDSGPPAGGPPGRILRFERSAVLPEIYAWIFEPGEAMLLPMVDPEKPALRFTVPRDGCGMYLSMSSGSTTLDRPRRDETESPAALAREHLSGLGIDITPPPTRDLRWRWWWRRREIHSSLTRTARMIGADRDRVVSVWFVGPGGVGPYTHAVATIRPGDPAEAARLILERAEGLAWAATDGEKDRPDEDAPGLPRLSVLTYQAGERMAVVSSTLRRDEPRSVMIVPEGHGGLLVSLTSKVVPLEARRTR